MSIVVNSQYDNCQRICNQMLEHLKYSTSKISLEKRILVLKILLDKNQSIIYNINLKNKKEIKEDIAKIEKMTKQLIRTYQDKVKISSRMRHKLRSEIEYTIIDLLNKLFVLHI